jgi:hypothetical protein
MKPELAKKLLGLPDVVHEIQRHQWIESEKAKRDIGFEKASQDWLAKYAEQWMKYHMPEKAAQATAKSECCSSSKSCEGTKPQKRSAKSYK